MTDTPQEHRQTSDEIDRMSATAIAEPARDILASLAPKSKMENRRVFSALLRSLNRMDKQQ